MYNTFMLIFYLCNVIYCIVIEFVFMLVLIITRMCKSNKKFINIH
jgi:hypothetical protein